MNARIISAPIEDIRIQSVPAGTGWIIRVQVKGGGKWFVDAYNFQNLLDLSARAYARLNQLVLAGPLAADRLADGHLVETLQAINDFLYGTKAKPGGQTLGEIVDQAITGAGPRKARIVVSGDISMLPWELTSPSGSSETSKMLGSVAHVVGELAEQVDDYAAEQNGQRAPSTRRSRRDSTFGKTVHIRAAGLGRLVGAIEEERLLLSLSPLAAATVAPAINSPTDIAPFFAHFAGDPYQATHFFAHCEYDKSGFVLEVSNNFGLDAQKFYHHRAAFPENGFHFLNVCKGAPTPREAQRSLLEYFEKQQSAGGVLASLIAVRGLEAVELARAFYAAFLPSTPGDVGRPAVEALFDVRQTLLKAGSAAGYLYRLYGRPDLQFVPLAHRWSEERQFHD